jgi:DNA-directed RNA polymerase specialized sigma24 family protein
MLSYGTLSDQQLASLLRDGDRAAFTEIYHRYKALLYIFAYKRIGQREEARDIIHELFLSLWTKHNTLEINTGLAPYLYTAVRTALLTV